MFPVIVFINDEFETVVWKDSAEEARGFACGAEYGSDKFAGYLLAYVWPDHEEQMREQHEHKPTEIEKALAAVKAGAA